ncbi:MAG: GxxExxY protein, partial [Candidatus Omnitrophica bacterium]|nr:GxxExxY protein [Candidatus Omnitrophota bacterium]MBD3269670.1 GxxExxY protein [Candidatus Omnitrophota bacterium]
KGEPVGIYQPDFIIEDKAVVEIKSLSELLKVNEKQLRYYLRSSKYKVGYLVNFENTPIEIIRRVYDVLRNKDSMRESAFDKR